MGARILVVDDSPTIRRVVASILQANAYEAFTAADGLDALETLKREDVDLVLADFVMPRMNGYQLCRVLQTRDRLKHLPVVLMSARSEALRDKVVQQAGALDAITKPFDALALVAVVEAALTRHQRGARRSLLVAEAALPEDPLAEAEPECLTSAPPPPDDAEAGKQVGTAIAQRLVPTLREMTAFPDTPPAVVTEAMTKAMTPDARAELWELLQSLHRHEASEAALAGDLSVFSIAVVMQILEMQRQSGSLVISAETTAVTIDLREGQIDFATSTGLGAEFLLGRYLVQNGTVTREALEEALQPGTSGIPAGEVLVGMGLATEEEVRSALESQTTELIYEVVRWKDGRFAYTVTPPDLDTGRPRFGLAAGPLVMEGFRRVDEWHRIEDSINFNEVLHRDVIAIGRLSGKSKLTQQEREVLEKIDGRRTVRETIEAAEGSSFAICKILHQLLSSQLVRRSAA